MTGRTHAICGITTMTAITACNLSGIDFDGYHLLSVVSLFTVAFGAYMPDVDLHSSKMGSRYPWIAKHLKHRGITHTLLVPLILTLLQWMLMRNYIPFLPELLFGFNIGWITHVVADMFNKKGVPFLWPIVRSNLYVATVLTGSWQENVFMFLWVIAHALVVYCIF